MTGNSTPKPRAKQIVHASYCLSSFVSRDNSACKPIQGAPALRSERRQHAPDRRRSRRVNGSHGDRARAPQGAAHEAHQGCDSQARGPGEGPAGRRGAAPAPRTPPRATRPHARSARPRRLAKRSRCAGRRPAVRRPPAARRGPGGASSARGPHACTFHLNGAGAPASPALAAQTHHSGARQLASAHHLARAPRSPRRCCFARAPRRASCASATPTGL